MTKASLGFSLAKTGELNKRKLTMLINSLCKLLLFTDYLFKAVNNV